MSKRLPLLLLTIVCLLALNASAQKFRNTKLSDEARISDLMHQLTLDEKIHLLSTDLGVERLGIPHCGQVEALHGLCLGGEPANWGRAERQQTTIFPQSYGLGCTWDAPLLQLVGAQIADEARWQMNRPNGRHHSLVMRSPNADLARDPRWGRTEESYGEDPQLCGTLSAALARGLQGDNPRYWKTASLMKHFLANSNEDGRDSTSSDFSERLFHEYYSFPFYIGMRDGNAHSFMASYNGWNGTAMAMNPVLQTVVRQQWGMKGIICTDGGALNLLFTGHHAFPTRAECAAAVVKASTGQFLDNYEDDIRQALRQGMLTESDIDGAIRYNLYTALRLGLLDDACPYVTDSVSPNPCLSFGARQLAYRAMVESAVLLKNDGILPLQQDKIKRIAVVGPYADKIVQDWYSGDVPYEVTILEGIRRAVGTDVEVLYAPDNAMDRAVKAAREADIVIACVGNHPYGTSTAWKACPVPSDGREAVDRKSLALPDEDLLRQLHKANPNTVLVLVSSFPYAINWSDAHLPAILHVTHCCQEQGTAVADLLMGSVSPSGRTVQTWPSDITQLPDIMDYDITHGRTYMYFQGRPLYPFGYGLSYTHFRYDAAKVVRQDKQHVYVDVTLTNTGSCSADEVVQLYASYPQSHVSHPARQLRAFQRATLPAGETSTLRLAVSKDDLRYWDEQRHAWASESSVTFHIGGSSADTPLSVDARL